MNTRTQTKIRLTIAWPLLFILGGLLGACQNAPTPSDSPLHRDMDALLKNPLPLTTDSGLRRLQSALTYFEQIDEAEGQWRANKALADWHIKNNQASEAIPYASRGLEIARQLSESEYIYASALQIGQLSDPDSHYSLALEHAVSYIDKALALTLLQRFDAAESAILKAAEFGSGNEEAFIYYHIGKHQGNLDYILKAREYYQRMDNSLGVIDSLFVAAQISGRQDANKARNFAERALRAAKHSDSKTRISVITEWLADQSHEY